MKRPPVGVTAPAGTIEPMATPAEHTETDRTTRTSPAEIAGPMGRTYSQTPCCAARVIFDFGVTADVRRCRRCGVTYDVTGIDVEAETSTWTPRG